MTANIYKSLAQIFMSDTLFAETHKSLLLQESLHRMIHLMTLAYLICNQCNIHVFFTRNMSTKKHEFEETFMKHSQVEFQRITYRNYFY